MVTGDPHVDDFERLPTSLAGAVENLDTPFVRGVYGDMFVDTYLTMLRHEVSLFERQVTPWERERYQDVM